MRQLWTDESGFIVSSELVLVSSILVLGLMVGLASVRDQVVQELGDVGAAIAVLNQSIDWFGITGHTASIAGSHLADTSDVCDNVDGQGAEPGGLWPGALGIDVLDSSDIPESEI